MNRGVAAWLRGGLALGAAAGGVCALVEGGYLVATAFGYFDGPIEALRLLFVVAALAVAAGALAGFVEGALGFALARAGRHRPLVVALLSSPAVIFSTVQLFSGPRARTLAARPLLMMGVVLAAVIAIGLGARLVERRPAWLWATLPLAVALYVADQRILPRLYPVFHAGLDVLVFACAQVAVWLRLRRPVSLRQGLAITVAATAAAALAFAILSHERGLRMLVLERTRFAAPIAKLSPVRAPAPVAVAEVASQPLLPSGPRLGDVDVFLVTIDAMRADRLTPETAPFLSSLAARGVRFDRAYTQVPHTSFAVATLLTGKHVYALSRLGLEAAGHQTLAEILKRERYKTAAFYPPSVFYIDHDRLAALEASAYGFEYVKYEYLPGPRRTQQVMHFLEAERPRRAFVWIHYLEPHEPYDPHQEFPTGNSARERYDGEIRFVDAEVRRLVEYLQRERPHSLLVVAADHGEELGEHGGHYHGTTLYDEQVRVPLFFARIDDVTGPAALTPRTVRGAVGLVDVAPTILSLLGIAPPVRMRGRDLGPWMTVAGAPEPALGPAFAEIDKKKMILDGDHKLICDLESDACQLFDLARDPGERKNLVDASPELANALQGRLRGWMAAETKFERERMAVDEPTRKILERARRGERVPELAGLLRSREAAVRREAARLLAGMPLEGIDPALLTVDDEEAQKYVEVARARLGDAAAQKNVRAWASQACDGPDTILCARAALISGDVPLMGRALEGLRDERELEVQLVSALGASHDARAFEPLLLHLSSVRTRVEVVEALGALGDARALPWLVRWIPGDPYIPVRAAMARVLAKLASTPDDRAQAKAALLALKAVEEEAPVKAALDEALKALRN